VNNLLLIILPALNALGFVLWSFVVNAGWIYGAFLGLLTSSTVLLTLLVFTDEKLQVPPIHVIPFLLGSSLCFFLAELVKMKNISFSTPVNMTYIGLISPLFVVLFTSLFSTLEMNRYHIIGGIFSTIGAAFVLYGGK
jgi:drug/metabolite transporter (DMT)-like permease